MRMGPLLAIVSVSLLAAACSGDDAPEATPGDSGGIWTLTISRADGNEEVFELVDRPIVCAMDEETGIVSLCGINLDGIAVDFIQVNESIGETYSIEEP